MFRKAADFTVHHLKEYAKWYFLVTILLTFLLHLPIFSYDLQGVHVMRQAQTMTNVLNYVRYDFNILNPRIFTYNGPNIVRQEFPLMQWLIAVLLRIFGENMVLVRLAIFTIGSCSLYGFFKLIRLVYQSDTWAVLGTWALAFSPLFYFYMVNPLPDVMALCFAIHGVCKTVSYFQSKTRKQALIASVYLMLAGACKLQYLMFMTPLLVIFGMEIIGQKSGKMTVFKTMVFAGLIHIPVLVWYVLAIPTWLENGILYGVFKNQVQWSEIVIILQFHWNYFFPKILMNQLSLMIFIWAIVFMFINKIYKRRLFWILTSMYLIVLTYFSLEINMINIVHDYYMMPFLIPVFILLSYGFKAMYKWSSFGLLLSVGMCLYMPFETLKTITPWWDYKEKIALDVDLFENKQALRDAVPAESTVIMINDHTFYTMAYMIDKRGFVFWDDNLPGLWIGDMIVNKNATYLYSNSRVVDENEDVKSYIDHLVGQWGLYKVFKLKDSAEVKLN